MATIFTRSKQHSQPLRIKTVSMMEMKVYVKWTSRLVVNNRSTNTSLNNYQLQILSSRVVRKSCIYTDFSKALERTCPYSLEKWKPLDSVILYWSGMFLWKITQYVKIREFFLFEFRNIFDSNQFLLFADDIKLLSYKVWEWQYNVEIRIEQI